MSNKRSFIILGSIFPLVFLVYSAAAQVLLPAPTPTPNPTPLAVQPALPEILNNAEAETKKYLDGFKDLLAEESRTIDTYDKKGEVKKTSVVKSTFIVYQLTKDQNQVVEFRNVSSVDGKPVAEVDKRAQDFFTRIVNAESSRKEIDELRKESSRYDGEYQISGLTLFQSLVLSQKFRPFFDFKMAGRDSIDGSEVYTITYQQNRETPLVSVNGRNPDESNAQGFAYVIDSENGKDLHPRLRGTIWIDTSTYQIRREHRELTVQPNGTSSPVIAVTNDFDFQNSDFGILTPSKVTHVQSRIKSKGEMATKEIRVTMEYSNFSKPDVEVKSSEVKSSKP